MIYLHKVLPLVLSPLVIALILILTGFLIRRRGLVLAAFLILYAASVPFTSLNLIHAVEGGSLKLAVEDAPKSDAIVVLGGMIDWIQTAHGVAPEWGDSDRFWDGIALLKADRAPKLIFTGGKLPWQLGDETEGEVLKRFAVIAQVPEQKIFISDKVENTEDEARAVASMLDPQKSRIILVTSAFHMPRAKALFDKWGFEVFAYPVDFSAGTGLDWFNAFIPKPSALAGTEFSIRELVGRLYYRFKTYLS